MRFRQRNTMNKRIKKLLCMTRISNFQAHAVREEGRLHGYIKNVEAARCVGVQYSACSVLCLINHPSTEWYPTLFPQSCAHAHHRPRHLTPPKTTTPASASPLFVVASPVPASPFYYCYPPKSPHPTQSNHQHLQYPNDHALAPQVVGVH